jgi:hypothetical protein
MAMLRQVAPDCGTLRFGAIGIGRGALSENSGDGARGHLNPAAGHLATALS